MFFIEYFCVFCLFCVFLCVLLCLVLICPLCDCGDSNSLAPIEDIGRFRCGAGRHICFYAYFCKLFHFSYSFIFDSLAAGLYIGQICMMEHLSTM